MKKILVVLVLLVLVTGCGNKKTTPRIKEEKIKSNTNEEVIKSQEIDGLKIAKSSLVYEGGQTTLTTSITNISDKEINLDYIDIKYKDVEGKETVLMGDVGDTLSPNEVVYVISKTDVDLTKAVSVSYNVVLQK